jgi:hypothetical protein
MFKIWHKAYHKSISAIVEYGIGLLIAIIKKNKKGLKL